MWYWGPSREKEKSSTRHSVDLGRRTRHSESKFFRARLFTDPEVDRGRKSMKHSHE